jgi:phosphatidylglycerol:prolipoprotein diacylglycerol transferase
MPNELIHLFGPLSINSFGLLAALGLLMFYWLIQKHPQFAALHLENTFSTILLLGAGVGILGGKLLYRFSEADAATPVWDLFAFWTGGISVLGATLALLIVIPLYLQYKKIPILPFADLVCIHIPLFQAIARLGCFFAGCCFGASTHVPWGVIYTDPGCYAPLYKTIHPTQLYSALFLLGIFLLMYFVLQYVLKKPGELLCAYLMLMSTERFMVDFWRADRVFFASPALHVLSIYQWVAIGIFLGAGIGLILRTLRTNGIKKPEATTP